MYQSEQINEIMGALAKAQGKMSGAAKDSANPFFKSRYADLNSVWNACREALSENGLAVVQTVQEREGGDLCLRTTLGHSSGQWMASTMPIRVKSDGKTNEMQVMGSILSYLRRYSLAALVGVAPADEDDDGNTGGSTYKASPSPAPRPLSPKPVVTSAISREQASEIKSLLAQCDGPYMTKVLDYLADNGMPSVDHMYVTFFDLTKRRIQKHLSEDSMSEVEA